jgi:hypothetical protein
MPSYSRAQSLIKGARFSSGMLLFIDHIIVEKKKNSLYRIVTEEMQMSNMTKAEGKVILERTAFNIL